MLDTSSTYVRGEENLAVCHVLLVVSSIVLIDQVLAVSPDLSQTDSPSTDVASNEVQHYFVTIIR